MAQGTVYATVENGWTRYENTNPLIQYDIGWDKSITSGASDGNYHISSTANALVKFNFTGTSIRLVSGVNNNLSSNMVITIDGIQYPYSMYSPSLVWQICTFEKTDLEDREHYVTIYSTTTAYAILDAIDLPSEEKLSFYSEDTNKKRLIIKNPSTKQHYSLADKTLIPLPNTSDKNMILYGIEAGKEIQLDEAFDKINYPVEGTVVKTMVKPLSIKFE